MTRHDQVSCTGILRLLSPSNLNRYRIAAAAGAVECLVTLYEGAPDAAIRGNAQVWQLVVNRW